MGKWIRNVFSTDTLTLSECTDGYYLYDEVIGFNTVMRAKTEQEACIKAITDYQKNYSSLQKDYKELYTKVESFVTQFIEPDDLDQIELKF
jgi:hypothetical protein